MLFYFMSPLRIFEVEFVVLFELMVLRRRKINGDIKVTAF